MRRLIGPRYRLFLRLLIIGFRRGRTQNPRNAAEFKELHSCTRSSSLIYRGADPRASTKENKRLARLEVTPRGEEEKVGEENNCLR